MSLTFTKTPDMRMFIGRVIWAAIFAAATIAEAFLI